MNKRLEEIYSKISESSKDVFLNNEIDLDKMWNQEVWGVALQVDLHKSVKDKLATIQKELDLLEPNNFLLLPKDFQHISFNQIVFWNGEYSKGKKDTWANIKDEFLKKFKEQDNIHKSINLTFNKLIATKGAIIWCADDENDDLQKLRSVFLETLPFPKETTYLSNIAHTTVARYKNKLSDPQKVYDYLNNVSLSAQMTINKISIRKELVFPSIKTVDIAEINLT